MGREKNNNRGAAVLPDTLNRSGRRVFVEAPAASVDWHPVIAALEPLTLLETEAAGVCLAPLDADTAVLACKRLALHDGPHAFLLGGTPITFAECGCLEGPLPVAVCFYGPDAVEHVDPDLTLYVREPIR